MTASTVASPTRTVERALELLGHVCDEDSISLSEAARRAGLPTSTALRLLRTLEAGGWVQRAPDGTFCSGPRLIQLGAAALGRQSLARLAEPALRAIVAATGESAYLSIAGPKDTAIYVAMVEGTHPVRHVSAVGRAVPLAGLTLARVLGGATSELGYVAERDATAPDVTAIAAPIARNRGIAGALSIVGPSYRIDETTMHRYGQIVRREALELTRQLGAPTPVSASAPNASMGGPEQEQRA